MNKNFVRSIGAFCAFLLLAIFYPFFHAIDAFVMPNPGVLSWPVHIVSTLAVPVVVIATLVIVALLLYHGKKLDALLFIIALAWNESFAYIAKALTDRARPSSVIPAFGSSFPSGHAATATVFFGMIVLFSWVYLKQHWLKMTITIVSALLVVFVAFSRLYLHVHYITDIAAGFLLGAAVLFCIAAIREDLSLRR